MDDQQQQVPSSIDKGLDIGFRLGGRSSPAAQPSSGTGAQETATSSADPYPTEENTDTGTLGIASSSIDDEATDDEATDDEATELAQRIARELAAAGPEGWHRFEAVFALTTTDGIASVRYYDDDENQIARTAPSEAIVELARLHRQMSAQFNDGPWWRMELELDVADQLEADYDYGDNQPFPDDQMLTPDAYRADLRAFPRDWIPVWLGAYIFHGKRQSRSPRKAVAQARAASSAGRTAVLSRGDFPPLPVLWARWATIAAAFVSVGSNLGPRMMGAFGTFEGSTRSGSTLSVLPGGRAVLSGGVWNAPELDTAYNNRGPLPDLYAGAPEWVSDQVLDPRADRGMLSFCYWWEHGSWHRGQSPTADHLTAAVPGVWSADIVANIISDVISSELTEFSEESADILVADAEAGIVTWNTLLDLLELEDYIDDAFHQLSLAGLTVALPEALPQNQAIVMVREYILGLGVDTTDYPLNKLVAERLAVGWMVFVPTKPDEIAIGRAIFYIADDGVIEQSSSSTSPSRYIEGFEQRFEQRLAKADINLTM